MYNQKAYALGNNQSTIRDLCAYGNMRAAIVGRENIYDYSIGKPSSPTPKEVDQTMREILETMDSLEIHSYTSAQGDYETRKAIADDLGGRYGVQIDADELFLGCGTSAELAAVFNALAIPEGEILTIAPYFSEYTSFVEGAGLTLKVVPPDVPGFQIRLDMVEEMLTPNTLALIINSPNNPAGTVYTEDTLQRLAQLLRRKSREYGHPIYIVSDEPYRELVYGGVQVPFLPAIYPDTVICYSYSKSLSLPGERIGYVYVPRAATDGKELLAAVAGASRAIGHICAPSLLQKVIARCAHLRPDLEFYDRNRRALYEGLTALGYETAKPDGAFYLFVKAPGGDANAFMEAAKKKDLLVVTGDIFGCPGYVRICYCVSYDMIQRSMPVFRELIESYK